jgi:hypothetical protein
VKRASSRQSKRAQHEFYRAMLIFYYKHYRSNTPFYLHWVITIGLLVKGGRQMAPEIRQGSAILALSADDEENNA